MDFDTSPNDPLWFSHHAQLDRLHYYWMQYIGEALATDEDPCGGYYGEMTPDPQVAIVSLIFRVVVIFCAASIFILEGAVRWYLQVDLIHCNASSIILPSTSLTFYAALAHNLWTHTFSFTASNMIV